LEVRGLRLEAGKKVEVEVEGDRRKVEVEVKVERGETRN